MIPTGMPTPNTRAASITTIFLGETGFLVGRADLMIRPLLAVDARVIAFSSRFWSNMM